MSVEAIAAPRRQTSMSMTMTYARISDRTVADEYFAVSVRQAEHRRAAEIPDRRPPLPECHGPGAGVPSNAGCYASDAVVTAQPAAAAVAAPECVAATPSRLSSTLELRAGSARCWVSSVLGQLVKTKAQRERFFGPYPVIDEGADPVIGPVMERVREEI